jgi:hypothetical protein
MHVQGRCRLPFEGTSITHSKTTARREMARSSLTPQALKRGLPISGTTHHRTDSTPDQRTSDAFPPLVNRAMEWPYPGPPNGTSSGHSRPDEGHKRQVRQPI